jgi:crotonobetainyl-CoA:carnitine CoA-transferase CaiB-like acyl-CoA transferase
MRAVGPLDGVVVVETASALAGPHAAMMLGDMGARVIKVEGPRGDVSRGWGPPFVDAGDSSRVSTYFLSCNRNKESVLLDLAQPEPRMTLVRLLSVADVWVHNWSPRRRERLGWTYADLSLRNPALVVLEVSGFGPDGPQADRPGYDQVAQAEAGLMAVTGPPGHPTRFGVPITDVAAGMYGAFGVAAALLERQRTGQGRVVHTSLLAAGVGLHAFQSTRVTVAGENPRPVGDHHPSIAPYGLFQASDSPLVLAVGTDAQWRVAAEELGLDPDGSPDAGPLATNEDRLAAGESLRDLLNVALATRPARAWVEALNALGVPAGTVRDLAQVYSSQQVRSQGLIQDVAESAYGPLTLPGVPLRSATLAESSAGLGTHEVRGAPGLGEHTEQVTQWLRAMASEASHDPEER